MDYKEKYETLLANIKAYHARFGDTCNLKKELEECVPELRESEDERIRKNICRIVEEHMRHCAEAGIEIGDHREALQYLEKQKEQEPVGTKDVCVLDNTPSYSAAKKYFDSWIETHRDSPTKWGCFWEGLLYSGKLSKPAEWTDADEKILKRIIERLRFVIPVPGDGLVGVTFKHGEDAEAINWLKRRVTSQPQPKQEWSEEEVDAMVKAFSDNLPLCGEFQTYHDALVHTYRQGVLAALKALRPQPQWKPSEEQMCSLKNAIDYYVSRTHDEIVEPYLNTLYDDLKKL